MSFALSGDRTHDSCIRGKRLSARPQWPHGKERTTPRLILKYLAIIFPQRHRLETIWQVDLWKFQKNSFLTIYSIYEMECEKLFCKTNFKLKLKNKI